MGTPEFAVASLDALVKAGCNIVGVITAPDKPGGRGMQMQQSAVKNYAVKNELPILQPEKLKNPEFLEELKSLNADLQIVVAFRMLPELVWNMPPMGTVNLHGSLLPQYRGAAPINWAVINGEKETGVTTFKLQQEIDTGDILMQESFAIGEDETAGEVHDRMKEIGAAALVKTVKGLADGTLKEVPQASIGNGQLAMGNEQSSMGNRQSAIGNEQLAMGNGQSSMGNGQSSMGNEQSSMGNEQSAMGNGQSAMGNGQSAIGNGQSAIGNEQWAKEEPGNLEDHSQFTIHNSPLSIHNSPLSIHNSPLSIPHPPKHAPKIFTETCKIDFNKSLHSVYNLVRGLSPYPTAFCFLKEKKLKIYKAEKFEQKPLIPAGEMETDGKTYLQFACSDGYLRILDLQLEGKKRMAVEDFLRGYRFD